MIRRLLSAAALLAVAVLPVAAAPAPPEPSAELLARARAILERAPLIDAHNDLPSMLIEKGDEAWKAIDLGAVQPQLCADIPRLRAGRWCKGTPEMERMTGFEPIASTMAWSRSAN